MALLKKIILLFCILFLFLSGVVAGFLFINCNNDLVKAWGSIYPTESIDSVFLKLGQPAYKLSAGEQWGGLSEFNEFIPDEYRNEHDVFIFLINSGGPYKLFVFVNDDALVDFVWATTT